MLAPLPVVAVVADGLVPALLVLPLDVEVDVAAAALVPLLFVVAAVTAPADPPLEPDAVLESAAGGGALPTCPRA